MSTYDSPYIYGELGKLSATAADRAILVGYLKTWFENAGWSITIIPSLFSVTTGATAPTFGVCSLGPSNENFFGIGKSTGSFEAVPVTDVDTCYNQVDDEDFTYQIPTGLVNNTLVYTEIPDNIAVYQAGSYTYPGYPGATLSDTAARHAALVKIIQKIVAPVYYSTIANGDGSYTSYFGTNENVDSIEVQDYTMIFGGQLNTTSASLGGNGFIARSASNVVDGNFSEVYVYYDNSNGTGGAGSFNRIRFRTRVGSRFLDSYTIHPLIIANNEAPNTVSLLGGLAEEYDIRGFVGPYTYFLDQPELGTSRCSAWGGAFRIKRLDGETGEPNIKKAILGCVSGSALPHNPDSFRNSFTAEIPLAAWLETLEVEDYGVASASGHVVMCGFGASIGLGTQRDGIIWYNDIAPVSEPWMGWPIIDSFAVLSNTISPLFCQIPNAIVVNRAIALGEPPSPDNIFVFDRNKLFRYYQNNRYPMGGLLQVGSGTSMAFVVSDPRIFNGVDYDGLELYQVKTASLSPEEISANGVATLTITAADDQDLSNGGVVFVRSQNGRITLDNYIVEFAPGSQTATVDLTETGLETEEIVKLEILGSNNVVTFFSFTALAV